jgi:hypothetical protein
MKYWAQILIFLSWPLFIYVCYRVCSWVINKFEEKTGE